MKTRRTSILRNVTSNSVDYIEGLIVFPLLLLFFLLNQTKKLGGLEVRLVLKGEYNFALERNVAGFQSNDV